MKRIIMFLAILLGLAFTSSPAAAGWAHRAYARGYYAGAACVGCPVPVVVGRPVYYRGPAFYGPAFYPGPVVYGGPAYYGAYPAVGLGVGFY
jgi:hypothetical protein